ncbi:sigma-70 family RNA polymerase sigma factor [Aurantivibrio infirmus]
MYRSKVEQVVVCSLAAMIILLAGMTEDKRTTVPKTKLNDEILWSRWMHAAQQGDDESYHLLLDSLGNAITAYLRTRFGALSFLEDCVQECLLAIHQGRHTYQSHRPFRPWLFAIVRHKTIDLLRRRHYTTPVQHEHVDIEIHEPVATGSGSRADELVQREDIFSQLKPSFRQALIMTKVLGLSVREAASETGISEAAMKVRVHRAINAVQKDMKVS